MDKSVSQQEFDELDGIVIHLLTNDRKHAICSGEAVDPYRWVDHPRRPRKLCQACFLANRRMMEKEWEEQQQGGHHDG